MVLDVIMREILTEIKTSHYQDNGRFLITFLSGHYWLEMLDAIIFSVTDPDAALTIRA